MVSTGEPVTLKYRVGAPCSVPSVASLNGCSSKSWRVRFPEKVCKSIEIHHHFITFHFISYCEAEDLQKYDFNQEPNEKKPKRKVWVLMSEENPRELFHPVSGKTHAVRTQFHGSAYRRSVHFCVDCNIIYSWVYFRYNSSTWKLLSYQTER